MQRRHLPLALIVVMLAGCGGEAATESHRDNDRSVLPTISEAPKVAVSGQDKQEDLQPIEIVNAYFELLHKGRGPEAIRLYWDTQSHAQRLYGSDFNALSDEEQAQVAGEHERFLMGIYANPATAAVMKRIQITNVTESRDAESSSVQFDAGLVPGQPTKPQRLLFVNHNGRWRIVDMATSDGKDLLSRTVNRIYKSTGSTPLEYARGMTKELPSVNEMIDQSEEAKKDEQTP